LIQYAGGKTWLNVIIRIVVMYQKQTLIQYGTDVVFVPPAGRMELTHRQDKRNLPSTRWSGPMQRLHDRP
jgi:hypothetical protein